MRRPSTTVEVEVDASEVIDALEDDEILEIMDERGLGGSASLHMESVREAHAELLRGRPAEALAILERILCPKWKDIDACMSAYTSLFKRSA